MSLRMKRRHILQTLRKWGTMRVINLANPGSVYTKGKVFAKLIISIVQKVDTENQILDQIEHYACKCYN